MHQAHDVHMLDKNKMYTWVMSHVQLSHGSHSESLLRNVSHDSFVRVTWLNHMMPLSKYEPWLICRCAMTRGYIYFQEISVVRKMSTYINMSPSICVPWRIHTCDMTHREVYMQVSCYAQGLHTSICLFQRMYYSASTHVTWLMYMCIHRSVMCAVVTHVKISLSLYLPWHIYMCDVTHAYVYLQISGYVCSCYTVAETHRVSCFLAKEPYN